LTSLWGTIAGAVVVIGIPAMLAELAPSLTASTPWIRLLLSGGGLLATQLAYPQGIAGMVASAWAALGRRVRRELGRRPLPAVPTVALDASAVTVRFGGLTAVNALDLTVRPGEIVGLIGANGAGKTTLLNAVSGLVPVTSGSITVFGTEVTHLGPEYRAHHGVARSFQDARLFPGLTVREAIQLALAARTRSGVAAAALSAPWVRRVDRTTLRRASDIATAFGLEQWLDTPTDELSTGTRRVCDLAIQYATKPRLLLLDEPTAGVAQRDAEAFGPLIRKMASELGCAVVLIEHDVPMIMRTADRVYCLESGAVIASGSPAEVRTDRRVIESYLGQSAAAIERSGAAKPARARAQRTKGNVRVVPQHNGTARPHRNGSARRHLVGTKE
jgi:ABC-type branched-subunit amino acid transport system ATPase component